MRRFEPSRRDDGYTLIDCKLFTGRVPGKGNKERVVPYGPPAADARDHWLVRGRALLAACVPLSIRTFRRHQVM